MEQKKKKLLFIIQNLAHGGAEKVLVNLVNNIDKSKYEVSLQTIFDVGVNKKYLHEDVKYIPGIKWEFRGNSHLIKRIPAKWLSKIFIREKYDIVISYLEGSAARIVSGITDKDVKKVTWIHIEMDSPEKLSVGFKNISEAMNAYQKLDKVVFVSETVRDAFERTAGISMKNAAVIYNTNETEEIICKSKEKIEDPLFSYEGIKVCSVAKIVYTKGYDRLAKIHKKLIDEGIIHHIYILGVGEEKAELEKYISENNISNSFTFLGYRDNPYKYVANCDIYVCSSRREGFSTAVTESLIVGTPVVSTCCSGAKELLGYANEYGIVTENSEEGIYTGLKTMLLNEQVRKKYKVQAKIRGEKFNTKETVSSFERLIESLYL